MPEADSLIFYQRWCKVQLLHWMTNLCRPQCEHGSCVRPGVCQCSGGYGGRACSVSCPPGRWGPSCGYSCPCYNSASCDPVSGSCSCPPGWRGETCDVQCPPSRYGQNCEEICKCQNGKKNCREERGGGDDVKLKCKLAGWEGGLSWPENVTAITSQWLCNGLRSPPLLTQHSKLSTKVPPSLRWAVSPSVRGLLLLGRLAGSSVWRPLSSRHSRGQLHQLLPVSEPGRNLQQGQLIITFNIQLFLRNYSNSSFIDQIFLSNSNWLKRPSWKDPYPG